MLITYISVAGHNVNNLGFITYRCRLVHDIYLCYIYNIDLFVVVILIMMVSYEYERFGLHLYIYLFVKNGVPLKSTSLQKKSDFDFLSLATNRRFWSIFAWIRS